MKWANFLHIYQPANQADEIFERVVNECYRPLFNSLKENPQTKITLNINAILTEQLVIRGFQEVVDTLRFVAERGQIEFTDTAKYHTLLPFLDEDEIRRQINLNHTTNLEIIGPAYQPKGFFPPEMAYAPSLAPILESMGYQWIIIDEIAFNGKTNQIDTKTIYNIENTKLNVFFRERSTSNLIMSALIRREQDFRELLKEEYEKKGYIITGMDGETFGHHRPGLLKLLTELLTSNDFEHLFFSELINTDFKKGEVSPTTSTWASNEKDIEEHRQFLTWHDNNNKIHNLQWELYDLTLKTVKDYKGDEKELVLSRNKLDKALASDHFFWASAKPWWSLEVIELGAWLLLDTVQSIPNIKTEILERAENIYHTIIATSFEWQRTGYIRNLYNEYKNVPRIPFKDKTSSDGEPWIFDAFIELMKEAMVKAAEKENFEEATLWRDAIWKLNTKNDIYDSIHAVDLLRKQITNKELLDMIGKYRREYEKLSSGQPEQRS